MESIMQQHPMLNTAIKAAREAGDVILRYADRIDELDVMEKGRNDFVSRVDRAAEEKIIDTLKYHYPDHAIMAEETGHNHKKSDYEWIIDPLDGTTNYLHGVPQYAVSIALRVKGTLTHAVIYDPSRDDLFTATRGDGAMLNNKRLRVSKQQYLKNALLVTGIPYKPGQELDLYLETLRMFAKETTGVRRPGSAALDLAYVAAGRYDGFWEFDLSPWDIAAGVLIVQEAGGLVSDLTGGNDYMESGDIVAANPKVFKEMLQRLHPMLKNR